MTDLHDILPPPARTNTTPLQDNHPADHNAIVDAVNSLGGQFQAAIAQARFRTYDTVAARNADPTAHIDGMLTWASSERVMAVWNGEWVIIMEPFIPFTPRLWIGGTEYRYLAEAGYNSGYRHEFGSCRFYIAARFGELGSAQPTDIVYVMPPLAPAADAKGPFGSAYCVSLDSVGQVGGAGVFNGLVDPVLPPGTGAPPVDQQGHLSIAMPGTAGLIRASDLAPSGNFDIFWSGFYPTDQYS